MRYAPHLLLIRQVQRLDEAMATGRDVLPAFLAWATALTPWAKEDPSFQKERAVLIKRKRAMFEQQLVLPTLTVVAMWRPHYFGVMKRAGLFDLHHDTAQGAGTESNAALIARETTRGA